MRVRSSLVARTTLAILALSMVLGLTGALIVSASVDHRERQRSKSRLEQLLSTIERTAQISCYLNDRTLAAEIAAGLMRNHSVSGVRIASEGRVLAQFGRTVSVQSDTGDSAVVVRKIYSPFDSHEPVGNVELVVDRAEIHAEASSYSRAASLAMALQAALVAVGVAVTVYLFTTKPIRAISKELHAIAFNTRGRLRVPPDNRFDELGSLVTDVNMLIANLADLLGTERALRIAHELGERRMRLIFDKAETGIFVLNDAGALESWNPAFTRILHLTSEQLLYSGVTQLQQLLVPHAACLTELIRACLTTDQPHDLDLEIAPATNPRGAWITVSLNRLGPNSLQGIVNDITDRKRDELVAQALATQDTVTGLLNRRGLEVGLGAAFAPRSAESAPEVALLQIDLDHFKGVNDTHGHECGDQVLRHVATILQRNTRRGDLVARPGGDEFAIVLTGIADRSKAEMIANAIIQEVEQPIDIGAESVCVGASIGIAFAAMGDSPQTLTRRADAAMYNAKRGGRRRACIAEETPAPIAGAVA